MKSSLDAKSWLLSGTAFIVLLAIWQFFSQVYSESVLFILPTPLRIFQELMARPDRFSFHTWVTFEEIIGGMLIAFTLAFPLAWMMVVNGTIRAILQPLLIIVQSIPMFALAPIMVLWFGWTYTAIVIPTALMIFFPLTLNIYQGLRATPESLLDFFKVNQATAWQQFYKLRLPYALPHIFSGLRIAAAISGIGAIAGEWAGAQNGLGMLMLESRRGADLESTFGALFCLTAMSLALYAVVSLVEFLWQPKVWRFCRKVFEPKRTLKAIKAAPLLLLIALASCQNATPTAEKTRLMLDWLPNPDHVPLYVGLEQGYFQEEGIDLDILKVRDPGDVIPYLTSKQAEIGITYMPRTLESMSRGARVKLLGSLFDEPLNCFIFRKGAFHKPEDLSQAVIGTSGSSFGKIFLNAVYKTRGIEPKATIVVNFDIAAALASKRVDAVYGAYWNIQPEQLKAMNIETGFFRIGEFGIPNYLELIFVAAEGSKQAEKDFVEKFQRALQKSIDYSCQHPEEAFHIYLQHNPDKSQSIQAWERKAWLNTIPVLAKTQENDVQLWQEFYDWLVEHEVTQASFDWQRIFP
ncbi:MAG: hypothetical protein K0S07_1250 [Chlamydiales bacterium]|jgi:NitT/TauT family transport system substrate-binding protein|nr:hypothetical protein [Chlamydiales bacterium]